MSLHETPGRVNYEETRQLFLNNVLIEKLTDGTPAFYNSNILKPITGRTIFPMILEMLVAVGFLAPQQSSTDATVKPIPVVPYEESWKCPDCSPQEKYVLAELQEHTKISDRNALATIMGNIKQESNFHSNI